MGVGYEYVVNESGKVIGYKTTVGGDKVFPINMDEIKVLGYRTLSNNSPIEISLDQDYDTDELLVLSSDIRQANFFVYYNDSTISEAKVKLDGRSSSDFGYIQIKQNVLKNGKLKFKSTATSGACFILIRGRLSL